MKKIYLLAIAVSVFTLGLYVPRLYAQAQDRAEQRKINQQILDLQLELEDVKSEWNIFNDTKLEKQEQLKVLSWEIVEIEQEQDFLHKRADQIRMEIDKLKWVSSLNDEIVNCYQRTWDLYNDCLDAIIQVGLLQSRQAQ